MPSANQQLLTRDFPHLLHSLHNRKLHESAGHVWVRAEGPFLYDADGNEFIDALAGLWNVIAGHGRKELAAVAAKQMETLAYCSTYAGSTHPGAIELAERLAGMIYPNITRFFFTSGGGESTDTTVKTARYFWRQLEQPERIKVIARQWGYHGTTMAAMSATGITSYWPMFEPRVPGFVHIPSPYPYRYVAPPGISQGLAAANELEQAILREGPDTVAAFFAEPVQGSGGVIVPQDDYWPRIRQICDKYNILLAVDEVITGFGRTGKMFGLEHWGIQPDIIQFAKGITSGYFPVGGVGFTEKIAQVIDTASQPWMQSFTYSAHPVGCAVALKTLDIIEQESFPQQAAEKGLYLLNSLKQSLAAHPHVGDVRGLGLMCAVEFVKNKETKEEYPATEGIGQKVHLACQKRGLYTRLRGDVFCIAPPITTPKSVLDRIVEILNASVKEVLG